MDIATDKINNTTIPAQDILAKAQKAMSDMESVIKELRRMRTNVNQLIQLAPTDKPTFLMEKSVRSEAFLRDARTDLNLWIQKHFRGGTNWHDLPDPKDQREFEQSKFAPGHSHFITVKENGYEHACDFPQCGHYSKDATRGYPSFGEGHDEIGQGVNGELAWTCPNEECRHFPPVLPVEEIVAKHAQKQGIYEDSSSDESCDTDEELEDDILSCIWCEHRDRRCGGSTDHQMSCDLASYLKARDSKLVMEAYKLYNSWLPEDEFSTAIPNC